jgi:hypothetical protein
MARREAREYRDTSTTSCNSVSNRPNSPSTRPGSLLRRLMNPVAQEIAMELLPSVEPPFSAEFGFDYGAWWPCSNFDHREQNTTLVPFVVVFLCTTRHSVAKAPILPRGIRVSIQEHPSDEPAPSTIDRRRSARVEVLGRLRGHLRALGLPLTLMNLSEDGFLMEAPIQFLIGGSHEFRFTARGQPPVVLTARAIHTKSERGIHVVGMEFEDRHSAEFKTGIAVLLEALRR